MLESPFRSELSSLSLSLSLSNCYQSSYGFAPKNPHLQFKADVSATPFTTPSPSPNSLRAPLIIASLNFPLDHKQKLQNASHTAQSTTFPHAAISPVSFSNHGSSAYDLRSNSPFFQKHPSNLASNRQHSEFSKKMSNYLRIHSCRFSKARRK
jgi:hypothetical protein